MIDPVQLVLLLVIAVLTVLLVVLGIQVFFILKQLRTTIKTANKILENTENITESVSEPVSFLSGLLLSGKSLSALLNLLKHNKEKKEK